MITILKARPEQMNIHTYGSNTLPSPLYGRGKMIIFYFVCIFIKLKLGNSFWTTLYKSFANYPETIKTMENASEAQTYIRSLTIGLLKWATAYLAKKIICMKYYSILNRRVSFENKVGYCEIFVAFVFNILCKEELKIAFS